MAKKNEKEKKDVKKKSSVSKKTIEKEKKEVVKDATIITKKESINSKKNAAFIERLGAFLIDFMIISIVVSFITYPFVNNSNYRKLNEEATELIEKYQNGDIKPNTYINRAADINYDIARQTGLSSVISIMLFVNKNAYFYTVMIFEVIQWIVLFISAIMILSRKDKRGLHDIITHTEVIKENIVIEEVEGARV